MTPFEGKPPTVLVLGGGGLLGAAGRGERVLLLEPTAVLVRGALRGAALLEAIALRSRGAAVQIVTPDRSARALMGRLMDPDRGGRVLAAGYRQGLVLGG